MRSPILNYATAIDQTLRGDHTTPRQLATGKIHIPVRKLVIGSLILGVLYGIAMGLYGGLRASENGGFQVLSTMVKVPAVFLLTLAVTFPSLYVFSTLAGSRMSALDTLRLLVIAITVNLAVLAGLGPVTAFFVLCTESYPFIKLLNVTWFGIAGIVSLIFLDRSLGHVFAAGDREVTTEASDGVSDEASDELPDELPDEAPVSSRKRMRSGTTNNRSRKIFVVWIVVYGLVGAQMGWVLRPFVGSPDLPFELFRATDSNFFGNVLQSISDLLS